MAEHVGYVIEVQELEKHPNADKLQLLKIFGTETTVSLDVKVGDIGIYFPEGLRLSDEMCTANDLVRRKDENGVRCGGFLEPGKQNIKTIRLRGRYSDGVYLPISSIAFTGAKLEDFKPGDIIDVINGVQICTKYIPRGSSSKGRVNGNGNKTRKKTVPIAPLFAEHADTSQLAYNLNAFQPGDIIEITLKMHGTSTRTGHLPVFKKYKRSLLDVILRRPGTPIYEYGYVSGTRRTILENYEGGYYGSNAFREPHSKIFEGKLHKGETCFAEIVGYTDTGTPIMPTATNKSVGEEFVKQYGPTTEFSYGCYSTGKKILRGIDDFGDTFCIEKDVPQSDLYVYRMTYTDPDGKVIEYTPEYMRLRCEQMGVKSVPVLWKGIIPKNDAELGIVHDHDECLINAGQWIQNKAEEYYDGPDPIGKTHVREGVVVRNLSKPNQFCAYKHKNRSFKILSGIAIDNVQNNGDMDADRLAEV